jgi:hypothetical protein
MISFTPDIVERDFTPVAAIWQKSMNTKLIDKLLESKRGLYFTFDNQDRLVFYRNHSRNGNTFDIVHLKALKFAQSKATNWVINNEQVFSHNDYSKAAEVFIKRLNSRDPAAPLH